MPARAALGQRMDQIARGELLRREQPRGDIALRQPRQLRAVAQTTVERVAAHARGLAGDLADRGAARGRLPERDLRGDEAFAPDGPYLAAVTVREHRDDRVHGVDLEVHVLE